ncbi:MAG: amidohydrolase family protein [bacterium]|nr:amidohydrolase family protein [bacterium]
MPAYLRVVLILIAVVIFCGGIVYSSLQPPAPLEVPERGVTLHGVTVINPGRERRSNTSVIVRGNRIERVQPTLPPSLADDEDFAGMYVLPGLSDMHVHFPMAALPGQTELFAFLFLYYGITTVRDAGDIDGSAVGPAREGVAKQLFPGPRIYACGPFVDGDSPLWKNTRQVLKPEQAGAVVDEIFKSGFDCVKAYNGLSAEVLAALREAAEEADLPLIGHTPKGVPYEVARLDDAQHGIGIPPELDEDLDYPEIMKAWSLVDEARRKSIVETVRKYDMANTPTLVSSERLMRFDDYETLRKNPDTELLPRFYSDVIWSPTEGIPGLRNLTPEGFQALHDSMHPRLSMIKALYDAGARLHLGTDVQTAFVVPGVSLYHEMDLFVSAGLTIEQVWGIATRGPAKTLRNPKHGRIVKDALADLLIFSKDPTADMDAINSLEAVVADGRLYYSDDLEEQLGEYQSWFGGIIYETVSTRLVRQAMAAQFGDDAESSD